VVGVDGVEAENVECDMLERLDVAQNGEREEGEKYGERGENDKSYVETAVEFETGAAAAAIGEMLLIVFAHLRGNP
jgi:hypothetical protein